MIGIIVMTHGYLGKELINSCELIAGKTNYIEYLALNREDNIENFSNDFVEKLNKLSDCNDILVLTDLLGGSPCNIAIANLRGNVNYQILSGVNLPMMLEAVINRDSVSIEKLAEQCKLAAVEGINHVNKLMK